MSSPVSVPFVDLQAAYRRQQPEIEAAISRVLDSGWYILGPEVAAFEAEFARYLGVEHAVGVASGTDALLLALRALGIGPGDEVITVAHTAVATVAAIDLAGATPVLVDVDPDTCTLDPILLPAAISPHTKAIVPVHLYGQPADLDPILAFAERHGLAVVEDCAQAHGARHKGRRVGSLGHAAAFSFYPTKNLGALGDGGCVVSGDSDVAARLRALRQYGWRERYISETPGYNSRLDELQAAILRIRLARLDEDNEARRLAAGVYSSVLADAEIIRPSIRAESEHVFHLYVIQAEARDTLREQLGRQGIGTAIHYPQPVHLQPAYRHLGLGQGSLPVTEALAGRIVSLPMFPDLKPDLAAQVAEIIAGLMPRRR